MPKVSQRNKGQVRIRIQVYPTPKPKTSVESSSLNSTFEFVLFSPHVQIPANSLITKEELSLWSSPHSKLRHLSPEMLGASS